MAESGRQGGMKRSVICYGDGDVVDISGGDGGGASRRGGGRGEER